MLAGKACAVVAIVINGSLIILALPPAGTVGEYLLRKAYAKVPALTTKFAAPSGLRSQSSAASRVRLLRPIMRAYSEIFCRAHGPVANTSHLSTCARFRRKISMQVMQVKPDLVRPSQSSWLTLNCFFNLRGSSVANQHCTG